MRYLLSFVAAVALVACAANPDRAETRGISKLAALDMSQVGEPVDRIYLPRLDSWRPVDRKHLILFESPKKAYLVKLERPVTGPFYDELAIGVRHTASYLSAKFDYIIIDGWRHYIESIRPLTREQADKIS